MIFQKSKHIGKIHFQIGIFCTQKKAMYNSTSTGFLHIATNSFMNPRSIICVDNHNCPIKKLKDKSKQVIKCCNCAENHPSIESKNYPATLQFRKLSLKIPIAALQCPPPPLG